MKKQWTFPTARVGYGDGLLFLILEAIEVAIKVWDTYVWGTFIYLHTPPSPPSACGRGLFLYPNTYEDKSEYHSVDNKRHESTRPKVLYQKTYSPEPYQKRGY